MTVRPLVLVATGFAILLGAGAVVAQPPQPPPAPTGRSTQSTRPTPPPAQPDQAPPAPTTPSQPPRAQSLQNVRIDLTITDQRGGGAPIKKTVSVVAADGLLNRIRSSSQYAGQVGEVPLNVDVIPFVQPGGRIRLQLTLQYDLPSPQLTGPDKPTGGVALIRTQISETLNTFLEDGKPLVIAQSADPVSDRQVTVEVKTTVMK